MKILTLVHRFPYPPTRGDCIRSWGEVEYLSSRHDVWLACVDREEPAREHLEFVRSHCCDVHVAVRRGALSLAHAGWSVLKGRSCTEGYFWDQQLAEVVSRWGCEIGFDAVLTFSSPMAAYAALVPARRRVLDMNDVESHKWRAFAERGSIPWRWIYAMEGARLPRAEAEWIREHDVTLLVNEAEQQKLPAEFVDRSAVAHTGVDLSQYADGTAGTSFSELPEEPVIGMLGSMSYAPNVRAVNWFGRNVWPLIREQMPTARWLIVGRDPVRSVKRWGMDPRVTVTGFVDDVRPMIASMRAFACSPCEQIGVQTKLIEALAAGRPSVVTPQAAAGMSYDDPPPFAIAGSPSAFADATIRLLRDDAHARALARRAREVALATYSMDTLVRRIENWLTSDTDCVGTSQATRHAAGRADAQFAPAWRPEVTRA